jgi:hypothetical protein
MRLAFAAKIALVTAAGMMAAPGSFGRRGHQPFARARAGLLQQDAVFPHRPQRAICARFVAGFQHQRFFFNCGEYAPLLPEVRPGLLRNIVLPGGEGRCAIVIT